MNLKTLFETQAKLDERIVKGKGLEGQDLLDEKILALQVELGELANEWRGFKFWSENQKPNETGYISCDVCTDQPGKHEVYDGVSVISADCPKCDGYEEVYVGNRLLEEYVDCLHFILSIGLELEFTRIELIGNYQRPEGVTEMFSCVFEEVTALKRSVSDQHYKLVSIPYSQLFESFTALGKMLGFDWEQIEAAYFEKNKVNHARQNNGY